MSIHFLFLLIIHSLGYEGAVSLARVGLTMENIHHLNVEHCKLKARGIIEMLKGLAKNHTLETLFLGYNTDVSKIGIFFLIIQV